MWREAKGKESLIDMVALTQGIPREAARILITYMENIATLMQQYKGVKMKRVVVDMRHGDTRDIVEAEFEV